VVLALYICGLTANVAVGVMVRVVAEVSVRAAARAATRMAAKNKPMRLIGSWILCNPLYSPLPLS
jgi:predicted small secreted protein